MIKDLRDFLLESAAIANLIGDRIERGFARQQTGYPYLVMEMIGDSPPYHLGGEVDISRATVQIDAMARDTKATPTGALQAQQLADAVRNRISGYRGTAGDTAIRSVTLTRSSPLDEEPTNGGDYRRHRVSMDFDILYQRTVPDLT